MGRFSVVLPFAISGGDASSGANYPFVVTILGMVAIMALAIVLSRVDRAPEYIFLGVVACAFAFIFLFTSPSVEYTVWTSRSPYKITSTLTKVEENTDRRDQSDVILSGGEKFKVNEYMRDLTKFVGQEIVLKCDYDKMPEKKITDKTECDLSGSGSAPKMPSVSN
jgi:hypothetical protein